MIKSFNQFSSSFRVNEDKSITIDGLNTFINKDLDLITFLRNEMWTKSIKLFYGNDYKGDPAKDPRMPPSVSKDNYKYISFGDVFNEAWKETDDFCKSTKKYYDTISPGLTKIGAGATPYFVWIEKSISLIDPNIILGWLESSKIKISSSNGTSFTLSTTLEDSMINFGKLAAEFFLKRTVKISPSIVDSASLVFDPDFTKDLNGFLQKKYDFEPDWGLDNMLQYVPEMPGWNKVFKVDASEIGYWFTWQISSSMSRYLKIQFGSEIFRAVQKLISTGKIQINGKTQSKIEEPSVTQSTVKQPTATSNVKPSQPNVEKPIPSERPNVKSSGTTSGKAKYKSISFG